MQVRLISFDGCPQWQVARERLQRAIGDAAIGRVELDLAPVTNRAEALERGLRGSPTILIDGSDRFSGPGVPASRSCRIFSTAHGADRAPSVTQLVAALRRARDGGPVQPAPATDASFPASDPPEARGPGL